MPRELQVATFNVTARKARPGSADTVSLTSTGVYSCTPSQDVWVRVEPAAGAQFADSRITSSARWRAGKTYRVVLRDTKQIISARLVDGTKDEPSIRIAEEQTIADLDTGAALPPKG